VYGGEEVCEKGPRRGKRTQSLSNSWLFIGSMREGLEGGIYFERESARDRTSSLKIQKGYRKDIKESKKPPPLGWVCLPVTYWGKSNETVRKGKPFKG